MARFLLYLTLLPALSGAQGHIVTATPPKLIHQARPVYPKLAEQMRIQGTVAFNVVVDKEGIVDEIRLISGHPLLVKAAMDAVKQYRYVPAYASGVPVMSVITVSVTFSLGLDGAPDQPGGKEAVVYAAQRSGAPVRQNRRV